MPGPSYTKLSPHRFLFGVVAGIFFLSLTSNFRWFQSRFVDANDFLNVGQTAGEDEQGTFLFSLFLGGIAYGAVLAFLARYGAFVSVVGIFPHTVRLTEGTSIRAPPFSLRYVSMVDYK